MISSLWSAERLALYPVFAGLTPQQTQSLCKLKCKQPDKNQLDESARYYVRSKFMSCLFVSRLQAAVMWLASCYTRKITMIVAAENP
jgi:hypothetical protein